MKHFIEITNYPTPSSLYIHYTHVYTCCLYVFNICKDNLYIYVKILYTIVNTKENPMKSKNELVKQYIMDQLHKRIYLPGQLIESEGQLCEKLNTSRMTVRGALADLEAEGIVYKEKGRGTFIAPRPKYSEFKCGISFSKEVSKRGMVPSTKDATLECIFATEEIAKSLHIETGEKVWKVTRVRCADGIPVIFAEEYYIYSLCPNLTLDIVNQSTYGYLDSLGVSFAFADQKMEAILCPKNIAEKLNIRRRPSINYDDINCLYEKWSNL